MTSLRFAYTPESKAADITNVTFKYHGGSIAQYGSGSGSIKTAFLKLYERVTTTNHQYR